MKIILTKTNEVKEVALGYAVNYLLPKGLGVMATEKRLEDLKKAETELETAKKTHQLESRQQAERLDGKVIELKVKAGKSGKIHGSVTKKEIAKVLKILKTQVVLVKPIKKIGEYEIELNFGKAKAQVKLKLEAEA